MTPQQLEALRPELAAWNAAVRKSRREYAAHPFAICLGIRRHDGEATPCTNVRDPWYGDRDDLCRRCEIERRQAAERMAARRAAACAEVLFGGES